MKAKGYCNSASSQIVAFENLTNLYDQTELRSRCYVTERSNLVCSII